MMSTILTVLKYMFSFIALLTAFIILLMLITDITIKNNKISEKNIKIFGLFFELTNRQLFSISLSLVKLIFVLFFVFVFNVNIFVLFAILSIVLIFNLLNFRFFNFFVDVLLHGFLYLLMLSKDIFYHYLREVGSEWYVNVLLGTTMIISVLLILILFFKEIQYIIKKNKFVKKKVEKEVLQFGMFRKKNLKKVINKVSDKEFQK